jgi:DNA-binding transcriptional MerR regulator
MATDDASAGAVTPGEGQLRLDVGDAEERVGYRGPTVCKIVGITYRQLDYWARTELVQPSVRDAKGSGTQRLYSFDDVVQLRVVKRLLDTGVSLQRVRSAVDELDRRGQSLADVTLVADGTTVYAVDDSQQLIDLLQKGQGVFAIAVGPVVDELKGEVTAFPTERVEDDDVATPAESDAAAAH